MAQLFLGLDSAEGSKKCAANEWACIDCGVTDTVESPPAAHGFKVERFVMENPMCWNVSSLIVDGRELVVGGSMPASAFVGSHPLFIEAECPKGSKVKVTVTNKGGAAFRFTGVLSGPELSGAGGRCSCGEPLHGSLVCYNCQEGICSSCGQARRVHSSDPKGLLCKDCETF